PLAAQLAGGLRDATQVFPLILPPLSTQRGIARAELLRAATIARDDAPGRRVRTPIARIADTVAIGIELIAVRHGWAIVVCVADAVAVRVEPAIFRRCGRNDHNIHLSIGTRRCEHHLDGAPDRALLPTAAGQQRAIGVDLRIENHLLTVGTESLQKAVAGYLEAATG